MSALDVTLQYFNSSISSGEKKKKKNNSWQQDNGFNK